MENRIMEEVDAFLDKIGRFNGQPFDVADMVHVSTANVTCSVSFGKRYDYDDKDFIRLTSSISEIASNSSLVGLTMFLPFLQYLPGDPLKLKDNLNSMSKIEDHCREKLNEHKETFQENDIRDVLDSLISRQKAGHGHDKVFTGKFNMIHNNKTYENICLLSQDNLTIKSFSSYIPESIVDSWSGD